MSLRQPALCFAKVVLPLVALVVAVPGSIIDLFHPLAAKALIVPSDLRAHRVISSPAGTPYGQSLYRAYGRIAGQLRLDLEVRSSTSACWFAQAGAGVAVVDRAAVAGGSFTGLAVRRFRSGERLETRIIRNRYRPMSKLQEAFCAAFDRVWIDTLG